MSSLTFNKIIIKKSFTSFLKEYTCTCIIYMTLLLELMYKERNTLYTVEGEWISQFLWNMNKVWVRIGLRHSCLSYKVTLDKGRKTETLCHTCYRCRAMFLFLLHTNKQKNNQTNKKKNKKKIKKIKIQNSWNQQGLFFSTLKGKKSESFKIIYSTYRPPPEKESHIRFNTFGLNSLPNLIKGFWFQIWRNTVYKTGESFHLKEIYLQISESERQRSTLFDPNYRCRLL